MGNDIGDSFKHFGNSINDKVFHGFRDNIIRPSSDAFDIIGDQISGFNVVASAPVRRRQDPTPTPPPYMEPPQQTKEQPRQGAASYMEQLQSSPYFVPAAIVGAGVIVYLLV
jgi:hypothetical protein